MTVRTFAHRAFRALAIAGTACGVATIPVLGFVDYDRDLFVGLVAFGAASCMAGAFFGIASDLSRWSTPPRETPGQETT